MIVRSRWTSSLYMHQLQCIQRHGVFCARYTYYNVVPSVDEIVKRAVLGLLNRPEVLYYFSYEMYVCVFFDASV